MTLLLGRMITAAPIRPVSSSQANRIFSICSSGLGSEELKSDVCVWMARMSSGDAPSPSRISAA